MSTQSEETQLINNDDSETNSVSITVVYRDPPEIRLLTIQISDVSDHRLAYSKFKSQVCREFNLPKSTPFMLKDHVQGCKMTKERFSDYLTSKQFPSVWKLITQNVTPDGARDSISSTTSDRKLSKSESLQSSQSAHSSLMRGNSEAMESPNDVIGGVSYRSKFFAHPNSHNPTLSSNCTLLSVEYDHSSLGYNYKTSGGGLTTDSLHRSSLMTIDTFGLRGGTTSSSRDFSLKKLPSRPCCELIHPESKLVNLNWDMDANCYIMKIKIIYIPSLITSYNLSNNPELASDINSILKDFGTKIVFFYEPNSNIAGASSTISIPKPSTITQVSVGDLLLSVDNRSIADMDEAELSLNFEYPKEDLFPLFLEILLWTDLPRSVKNLITQSLSEHSANIFPSPHTNSSKHYSPPKTRSMHSNLMNLKESPLSVSFNGDLLSPTHNNSRHAVPSQNNMATVFSSNTSPTRSGTISPVKIANNKKASPQNSPIIKAFQLGRPRIGSSTTESSKKHSRSDSFKFVPITNDQNTKENSLKSPIKSYMKNSFETIPEQKPESVQTKSPVEIPPKPIPPIRTSLCLPDLLSPDNELENTLTSVISPLDGQELPISNSDTINNNNSCDSIDNAQKGGTLKAKQKKNSNVGREKSNEEINELTSPVQEKIIKNTFKFHSEDNIRSLEYNSYTTGRIKLDFERNTSDLLGVTAIENKKQADSISVSSIRSDNKDNIYMAPNKINSATSPISNEKNSLSPLSSTSVAEFVNPSFQRKLHGVYQSFDSIPQTDSQFKDRSLVRINAPTVLDSDLTSDESDFETDGLNLSQNNYERSSQGRRATRHDPRYRMSAIHVGLITPIQKRKFPDHRCSNPGIFSTFEDEFVLKHSSSDVSPQMAQSYTNNLNQRRSKMHFQSNQGLKKSSLDTAVNPNSIDDSTDRSVITPDSNNEDNEAPVTKTRHLSTEHPSHYPNPKRSAVLRYKEHGQPDRQPCEFVHPAYREQYRYKNNINIGNMEISLKMHIKLLEKFQSIKVGPLSRKQEFDGRVNKKAQDRSWKAVYASIYESDVYFYKNEKDMHFDQMQFTFSQFSDKSKAPYESIISVHHAKLYIPNDYMANKGHGTSYVFRVITENESSYLIRANSLPTMFGWILALYQAKELPPTNHPDSQGLIQEIERRRTGIEGANKLMKMVQQKMKNNKILFPRRESKDLSGIHEQQASSSPHHALVTCPKSAENDKIPLIVETCIREIEERAIDAEGIYRVSGTARHISSLRDEIHNKGVFNFDIEDERWADENNIAGLLKLFFKELTCPIVTPDVYDSLIQIITKESQSHASIIQNIQSLVQSLPEVNILTLDYLIAHISRVAQHSDKNRMSVKNLSIVFGPTLITRRDIATIDLAKHNNAQVTVMEFLIIYYEQIFNCQPIPEHLKTVRQNQRGEISRGKTANSSIRGSAYSNERLRRVSSSDMPSNTLSPTPVSPQTSYTDDLPHLPLTAKLSRSWSEEVLAKPDIDIENALMFSSTKLPHTKEPIHNLMHYCYKDNTDLNIKDSMNANYSDEAPLLESYFSHSHKLTKSATSVSLQAYSNSALQNNRHREDDTDIFFKRSANTPHAAPDNYSSGNSPTTDNDSARFTYTPNPTIHNETSFTNDVIHAELLYENNLTPIPNRKQSFTSNHITILPECPPTEL